MTGRGTAEAEARRRMVQKLFGVGVAKPGVAVPSFCQVLWCGWVGSCTVKEIGREHCSEDSRGSSLQETGWEWARGLGEAMANAYCILVYHDSSAYCQAALGTVGKKVWFQL